MSARSRRKLVAMAGVGLALLGLAWLAWRGTPVDPSRGRGGIGPDQPGWVTLSAADPARAPVERALRSALGSRGPAGDAEGLYSILKAARDAQEDERYAEMLEHLSRAFADIDALMAYVERSPDAGVEPEERAVMVWALEILARMKAYLTHGGPTGGSSRDAAVLEQRLGALFQRLLARLGEYPRDDARRLLATFDSTRALGEEFLEVLHGWLVPFDYFEPLVRMVVDLALRTSPPRYDIVMDLIHSGRHEVLVLVAERVRPDDHSLSLELILELAREVPRDSPLRHRVDLLMAMGADPDAAFDHLQEEAASGKWDDQIVPALALASRGLHEQAFERYAVEPDLEVRKLLVLAGRGDGEFLEHVLDVDPSYYVRGGAVLNLAHQRPDVRTGERLEAELRAALYPSPLSSGADCPHRTVYPEIVLLAIRSYRGAVAPGLAGHPVFGRLRSLVRELSQRPGLSDSLHAAALETLKALDG